MTVALEYLKQLFATEKHPRKGLLPWEWAVLTYAGLTGLLMAVLWPQLIDVQSMIDCRVEVLATMAVTWGVYMLWPCPLTMLARAACQLVLLGIWYPDTYEFNRLLPNLDHHFAAAEQWLFGCQPSIVFSEQMTSPVLSELLSMGYFSYYPLIGLVTLYYFLFRPHDFNRATFTIIVAFFLFYAVFIVLPVAGPQYYFQAVGLDNVQAGVLPDLGHYFEQHQESLPIPGVEGGFFHGRVVAAHYAGERPTAAFPSSHVGVTVVLLWLAWSAPSRWLLWFIVPFAVLMFFATFYIQAHYVIDAIAGLAAGTIIYFICQWLYRLLPKT